MKKPNLGSQNPVEIPQHLILDNILPRLPVKSLLRFKTVSKTWLSSISTPAFQKSHLRFSSSAPKFLLSYFYDFDSEILLLSYDESKTIVSDLVQLDSSILSEQSNDFFAAGSCNGVMCWFHEPLNSFTLWNPATRHYKHYKPIQLTFDEEINNYGFGYVSSTDDYKILVIIGYAYFCLFSLNTGTWRRLNYLDGMYYASSLGCMCAVYMDETLYWPFMNKDTWALVGIIGFNLVTDQMNKVQKIPWISKYSIVDRIFKIQGCLSLCCRKDLYLDSDIWMLKQRGGLQTWTKLFSIDCRFQPFDFTENGKYLVMHSGQVKLIDPDKQDADLSADGVDCDDALLGSGIKHVESLVSF